MSKLLQVLCNPSERVPLETLLKCEKALEKMEPCLFSGAPFVVSIESFICSANSQNLTTKCSFQKSSNPIMEVLTTTLQSAIANHTLHRTFKPSLELMFGTDIW